MNKKAFTLAELLIVVAIIAVLVGVSIPVFNSQLEKSREAKDLANVRTGYAEVMAALMGQDKDGEMYSDDLGYYKEISLSQKVDDWQMSGEISIGGITPLDNVHWIGNVKKDGKCLVHIKDDELVTTIEWLDGDGETIITSGYKQQKVTESAAKYEAAINNTIKVLYDELVAEKLSQDQGQISFVLFENGKVVSVKVYSEKDSPKYPGNTAYATSKGTTEERNGVDFDGLNTKISEALKETGYEISGTCRIFFDKEGNTISNYTDDGTKINVGGQGTGASLTFKGNGTVKFYNDSTGWYK